MNDEKRWAKMLKTLEIHGPLAYCGKCRFVTRLAGSWHIQDGQLIWESEPDPVPYRGPSLDWCSECGAVLELIEVDDNPLTSDQRADLIARADAAQLEFERSLGPVEPDDPEPAPAPES